MATKEKAPLAMYLDREPGIKQKAFADWIIAQTGYDVDLKSVQLSLSLTQAWRDSDELAALKERYVTVREKNRTAAEARRREQAKAKREKLLAELAKAEALLAESGDETVGEPEPEPEPEPEATVTPIRPAAKKAPAKKAPVKAAPAKAPAAKKAPAKKAPAKKPAPAAKASAVLDDDDF